MNYSHINRGILEFHVTYIRKCVQVLNSILQFLNPKSSANPFFITSLAAKSDLL